MSRLLDGWAIASFRQLGDVYSFVLGLLPFCNDFQELRRAARLPQWGLISQALIRGSAHANCSELQATVAYLAVSPCANRLIGILWDDAIVYQQTMRPELLASHWREWLTSYTTLMTCLRVRWKQYEIEGATVRRLIVFIVIFSESFLEKGSTVKNTFGSFMSRIKSNSIPSKIIQTQQHVWSCERLYQLIHSALVSSLVYCKLLLLETRHDDSPITAIYLLRRAFAKQSNKGY